MESQISTQGSLARIGAISAPLGAVVLLVATVVHPMGADPNDAPAAFAEYAADPSWVWSHLGQFAGVAVLGMALIGLAATFETGQAAAWARIGVAGTAATIAMAAALQAVDGAALKVTVDRWAAATAAGAATASVGFAPVAMTLSMLASLLFVIWIILAAILMWRMTPRLSETGPATKIDPSISMVPG